LGTTVERIELHEQGATVTAARSESHSAAAERDGRRSAEPWTNGGMVRAKHVFSTLPLPQLARLLVPSARYEALAAASELRFRALLLVYAVHEGGRWSGHDVHYLPSPAAPVTRISEPANHRIDPDDPSDRSVICFEIPCQVGDELWSADERQLADLVQRTVSACALPPLRLAWVSGQAPASRLPGPQRRLPRPPRGARILDQHPAAADHPRPPRPVHSRQRPPCPGHGLPSRRRPRQRRLRP
jgi:hypothetical protein